MGNLAPFYLKRHSATLDRLRIERQSCVDFVARTLDGVEEGDGRDLSATEREGLERQRKRIGELDAQIAPLEAFEQLRGADQTAVQRYTPTGPADGRHGDAGTGAGVRTSLREHKYETRGHMIVDMLLAADTGKGGRNDAQARDRLMAAGVPAARIPGAPEGYQARAVANEITTDVPGLIPKPIVGPVNSDLDAARPFVQSIGARDLAGIPGKVFTRPTVTQHVTVGKQTTEKSELPSQKYTVGGVDMTKETWGGVIDVSRQVMDWTSPGAWDALLQDLQDVYAIQTEAAAATAFATAVVAAVTAPATNDLKGWSTALYAAAASSYAGAKRLPNIIYSSLDMWSKLGSIVDSSRLAMRGGTDSARSLGDSRITDFGGNVFDLPRVVVPSLPSGTLIVGVKEKTEFYEDRIGFLTAVEPRLLGVELAYGGYVAYGTLVPGAFAKIPAPA